MRPKTQIKRINSVTNNMYEEWQAHNRNHFLLLITVEVGKHLFVQKHTNLGT